MKLPKQPAYSQNTFWTLWGDKDKKVSSEGGKKGKRKGKTGGERHFCLDWEREQNNWVINRLREEMTTTVTKDIYTCFYRILWMSKGFWNSFTYKCLNCPYIPVAFKCLRHRLAHFSWKPELYQKINLFTRMHSPCNQTMNLLEMFSTNKTASGAFSWRAHGRMKHFHYIHCCNKFLYGHTSKQYNYQCHHGNGMMSSSYPWAEFAESSSLSE